VSFFNTLNYSSCNEDGLAELKALDISSSDSICCITGSGDRPLHLLLGDPAHILSFDLKSCAEPSPRVEAGRDPRV
jgi:S-adenosylmethionine-diacylglycerol 3-amino-3-carboxypropyl transferase